MDTRDAQQMKIHLHAASTAWGLLTRALGMAPGGAPTPQNADRMLALLDALLDAMREGTPPGGAESLLAHVTEWVTAYEAAHVPIGASTPLELLRELIAANGLKQRDLAAEMGGQPNLSAVLQGRRPINANQAARLGRRFSLSPLAFLDGPAPSLAAQPAESQAAYTPARADALSTNVVAQVAMPHAGHVISVTTTLH